MKEKSIKLLEKLQEERIDLLAKLEEQKGQIIYKLNVSSYKDLINLENDTEYYNFKNIIKDLEIIDVKIRTINYLLKD